MSHWDNVVGLVSKVRNARYGEMVTYLEALIDSGDWRDFSTPAGTHSSFRSASSTTFCCRWRWTRR